MVRTVKHGHLAQLKWVYPFKATNIIAINGGIRAAPVVGVNATGFAKKMLSDMGVELIVTKFIRPFNDADLRQFNGTNNRRAASAQRAIASARVNNTIRQIEHQFDIATMTGEAMSR
jgi:hypothetical protein